MASGQQTRDRDEHAAQRWIAAHVQLAQTLMEVLLPSPYFDSGHGR